jgi:hypothetical protein
LKFWKQHLETQTISPQQSTNGRYSSEQKVTFLPILLSFNNMLPLPNETTLQNALPSCRALIMKQKISFPPTTPTLLQENYPLTRCPPLHVVIILSLWASVPIEGYSLLNNTKRESWKGNVSTVEDLALLPVPV